jgi:hypothetical protein
MHIEKFNHSTTIEIQHMVLIDCKILFISHWRLGDISSKIEDLETGKVTEERFEIGCDVTS